MSESRRVLRRVLVTGANGFVCSNIIDVLLERGWHVTALDLQFDNPAVAHWLKNSVTLIEGTCDDLPALQLDAIIHGAAITAQAEELNQTPEENFRANLEPALKITEYARMNHVKRTILISSTGVYRDIPPVNFAEDVSPNPLGTYAVAKHTIEAFAETLRTLYKQDVIVIRLGNIYGPHEIPKPSRPRTSIIGRMVCDAVIEGKVNVYIQDVPREWTFAPDIGSAVHSLLDASELHHHLYHTAASKTASTAEIAHTIQRFMPDVEIVTHQEKKPDTRPLTRFGIPENQRLRDETGFSSWTGLSEGIQQTINTCQQRRGKLHA